jgi:DNA repair ATPase RecN
MATAAELLAECEAAISAAMQSQEYDSKGLRQKRARLAELNQLRRELIAEIREESANGGGMSSVGMIHPPS